MTRRTLHEALLRRLTGKRQFLQVLAGPRQVGKTTVANEVKSGRRRESLAGMEAFAKQFNPKRKLLVGGQGMPIEEFLRQPAAHWPQRTGEDRRENRRLHSPYSVIVCSRDVHRAATVHEADHH